MVKISKEIKEFIEEQGVFVVGTIGGNNLPNVSPRIFFRIDDEVFLNINHTKISKLIHGLQLLFLTKMN
jgi:nitroimidazol reductase NimA-like FMN-containing flavoprotein (pyridoxamine 5'-phosphate oxidase superfamily)